MKYYAVYEMATGELVRCGHCPDGDFSSQPGAGEGVIQGTGVETTEDWFYDMDIASPTYDTLQLKMDWTPVITGNVVTGIPTAGVCYVVFPGVDTTEYPVTGGTLTVNCAYPGTYRVRCQGNMHATKEFNVVVP